MKFPWSFLENNDMIIFLIFFKNKNYYSFLASQMYMSEKEQFKVLFGHDQPKKKVVSSFDESQSKTSVRTCTYVFCW